MNYIKADSEDPKDSPPFRCSECKSTFQKPILATLSSQGHVEKYNACPRCLSRVTVTKQQKSEEKKKVSLPVEDTKKTSVAKHKDDEDCQHFMGYLKTRPKDMSIPDECLTCDKMIECLVH